MDLYLAASGITWQLMAFCGLSLSVGWGIRGNFGHEYGAAIPGALAAMAAVLVSGRSDWLAHVHYFAMFGGLGWSFGGSMSYMGVVGYTHSGHPPSVLYGFANLFVIGFLWAFLGGAGTALPVFFTGDRLALFFAPLAAIFAGWALQSVLVDLLFSGAGKSGRAALSWYDTDWLANLVAMAAGIIVSLFRGGFDIATSLVLHLTIGWFVSFLVLVVVLKLRMTPPRGDNWAGCVGLAAGLLIYCWRYDLYGLAFAGLITGFIGGIGFGLGQFLKLLNIRTGLQTNWHSVMEQTQGLLFGIAIAVCMGLLSTVAPAGSNAGPPPAWTGMFATGFVLVGLTYLNHRKAPLNWVDKVASLPKRPYGLPVAGWFVRSKGWIGWLELVYIAIGIALFWLMHAHRSMPISFIPDTWTGTGQLLYLVFLWWVVNFNFALKIVEFTPRRLVTEGVITFNAVICTIFAALVVQTDAFHQPLFPSAGSFAAWIGYTSCVGLAATVAFTLFEWGLTHALFGRRHIPFAFRHIRFGPDATIREEVTAAGEPWKRT